MATNLPLPTKLELTGNLSTNWKRFKAQWTNYEIAARIDEEDKRFRTATLLTCIGPDALSVIEGFDFASDREKYDIDIVLRKLETFCVGKTNEIFERYLFNKRNQEQGETIDSYVSTLRSMMKTCNYGTLTDSLIRDRIVIGFSENTTRKRLLQEPTLTLQSCIDICRAHESTNQHMKAMSEPDEVHSVKHSKIVSQSKQTSERFQGKKLSQTEIDCKFCGRRHARKKEKCPAWGKCCDSCGVMNHFSTKCPNKHKVKSRHRNNVHVVDNDCVSTDDEYVLSIDTKQTVNLAISHGTCPIYPNRIMAVMYVGHEEVLFQVDSGATVNLLPHSVYIKAFNDPDLIKLQESTATLVMFNKTEVHPVGKRRIRIVNPTNHKGYSVEFLVVKGDYHPLLGARAAQQMHLITVNDSNILSHVETLNSVSSNTELVTNTDPLINKYEDIFTGEVGHFPGKLHLEIDTSVTPVKLPVRKLPLSVKPKLKAELDRLSKLGVITKVTTPTDWISSVVVAMKSDGRVRLCIDPKPLNKALKRNHYPMATLEDILPELSTAKVFSVVDVKNGFWHVELDNESSYLTTFATPFGRYRWLRLPFGVKPAPEEFQRLLHTALENLPGVKVIHDDVLVYGDGLGSHDDSLERLFQRCREKNIVLNKDKLKLRLSAVPYMGHVLTDNGLKPDPAKVEAIQQMPEPTDKQGVQRLMGMVNYVQRFDPRLSEVTAPLRDLMRADVHFNWDHQVHGIALDQVKQILANAPVLKYFNPNLETVLQCDASDSGLGACLMQDGHPIAYASRSLTRAESNYAQIEKELLAVLFAMEKFETYVYGRPIEVESDHKPLEAILKKSILSAPKRLQRMLLRLQKFDFHLNYKKGSQMFMADTLSRAYLPYTRQQVNDRDHILVVDTRSETEMETENIDMTSYLPISTERLRNINEASVSDCEMKALKAVVQKGWPSEKSSLPVDLQPYFPFREELSAHGNLLFKGNRLVVPKSCRHDIKTRVHSSHVGIQGCLRRARDVVYWPGMNKELEEWIGKCEVCKEHQYRQQKEPLVSHRIPSRPWQIVGCDFFEVDNHDYLVCVDYYSDFFEVDRMTKKTAFETIQKLSAHFARHGLPEEVVSDNGPPFSSKDFENFAKRYDFQHVTSSPGYAQSNGKSENAVKIAKNAIRKAHVAGTDPFLALLDIRNTPSEIVGSSPVQRLFSRRTRTLLPTSSRLLKPKTPQVVHRGLKCRQNKQSLYYNRQTKSLPSLRKGDTVRIQPIGKETKWRKARVDQPTNTRSYRVTTEDGQQYRRNRRFLRSSCEQYIDNNGSDIVPFDPPVTTTSVNPPLPSTSSEHCQSSTVDEPDRSTTVTKSGRVVRRPTYSDFVYQ